MKGAFYGRVSSEDQQDRETIRTQREYAESWCAAQGIELVGYYEDENVSGTLHVSDRPEGARILADAAARRFDKVIVYRFDRWGRGVLPFFIGWEELKRYGVQIQSATEAFDPETDEGTVMMALVASQGGYERAIIRRRCQDGINRKARAGYHLGGVVPYGYRVEKQRLVPCREPLPGQPFGEADAVEMIYGWCIKGRLTCGEIANRLQAMGVPTPVNSGRDKGRSNWKATRGYWQAETVRNILTSDIYAGVRYWGKKKRRTGAPRVEIARDQQIAQEVPPLVTLEELAAARRTLTNNRTYADRNARRPYLLRGLIRCAECGFTFTGATKYKGKDADCSYYICNGRHSPGRFFGPGGGKCFAPYVRVEDIEEDLWGTLLAHLRDTEGTLEKLRGKLGNHQQQSGDVLTIESAVRQSAKQKEAAIKRTVDLLVEGVITRPEAEEKLARLREEKADLEGQLEQLAEQSKSLAAQEVRLSAADDLLHYWHAKLDQPFTLEEKRHCIEAFVDAITIRELDGAAVATYRLAFEPAAETGVLKRTGFCCIEIQRTVRKAA